MNILRDTCDIFCSYCGYKVKKNKSKYDFTNYMREFMDIRGIKPTSMPSEFLFLVDKERIDKIFDSVVEDGYSFVIPKDGYDDDGKRIKTYFSRCVFKAEDIGEYGAEDKNVKEVTIKNDIVIPLKISLGKLAAGREVTKTITVKRCPNCLKELSSELGKHQIENIGFIGSPGTGKTSLIIALCHFIQHDFDFSAFGIDEVSIINDVTRNEENVIVNTRIGETLYESLKYYGAGIEVDKTEETGENVVNLNILIQSQKKTRIINFVDLAGEFWNNPETPEIDTAAIIEKRPIIGECEKFIICMPDDDIRHNVVNSNYAAKITTFFRDIEMMKNVNCCCIINKFDKLASELGIENIFSHISNEDVRNADYFGTSQKLLLSNGSYKNLQISTQEVFRALAGRNNPIGRRKETVFIPISPYGFKPKSLWIKDEKKPDTLRKILPSEVEKHFYKAPTPWHLEALLIWIIHQLDLIGTV